MPIYTANNINYSYTLGESNASVVESPLASGAVTILSSFVVDDITYIVTTFGNIGYNSDITSIIIPETINNFFGVSSCVNIEHVTILGTSITVINENCCYGCSKLKSFTIPESVVSVGNNAWNGCISLESITIPSSVIQFPWTAFVGCSGLKNIVIKTDSLIFDKTFRDATGPNLEVTFDYVGNVPNGAFQGKTNLTKVTFNNITGIGASAFAGCTGLTSISFPNSIISINSGAFSGCSGITSVSFPSSVTDIYDSAFSGCTGIISVNIPSTVTTVGSSVFSNCSNIKTIVTNTFIGSFNSVFENVNPTDLQITFNYAGPIPDWACYNKTNLSSIIIGNNITSIGGGAFISCSSLTSVSFPSSVNAIYNNAFAGCIGLTSINIPSTVTTVGSGAFSNCSNLASIVTNTYISNFRETFDSVNPTGLQITFNYNGEIPTRACENKSNLISVTIGENITGIRDSAFSNCTSLTNIVIGKSVTNIGSYTFAACSNLETISFQQPSLYTEIGAFTFYNSGVKNFVVPNTVTSIGSNALAQCPYLESITIPSSVITIANEAFYGNPSLRTFITNTYIPNLPLIFGGTSINLSRITYNYTGAITSRYGNLQEITIGSNITTIESGVFIGSGLNSVNYIFPSSLTTIKSTAFDSCSSLTSIIIPSSVTSIQDAAFIGCINLTKVYYYGLTLPTIGGYNIGPHQTAYYIQGANIDKSDFFYNTKIAIIVPDTPTITKITGYNIYFTQTPDNAIVTNYSYSIDGSAYIPLSPAQTTSPLTIPSAGITSGSTHTYRIKAIGAIGPTNASNIFTNNLFSIIPCFKYGTKILTDKGYVEINDLKNGDQVETFEHGLKPITVIGKKIIQHEALIGRIPDQLYKYTKDTHSSVFEDLIMTGRHAILVDDFISDEQKQEVLNFYKIFYKTDNKYLLPSFLDDNSVVYETPGQYTVYHLALQNDDENKNYGIYANGLLVETAAEGYLKYRSKMDLIE